jgi:hypothetical protein
MNNMEIKKYITRNKENYSYVELKLDENNETIGRFEVPFNSDVVSHELQTKLKELNVGDKLNVN